MRSILVALLAIGLAFLATEIAVRWIQAHRSVDYAHWVEIPQITAELAAEPAPRVLLVGNSLTRRGIVTERVAQLMALELGRAVSVEAIYPDDTAVAEWSYLVRGLVEREEVPELIVLPFVTGQLADGVLEFEELERIGSLVGWRGIAEVMRRERLDFGARIDLILAKGSAAYAQRQKVGRRVLARLPGYPVVASAINRSLGQSGEMEERVPTYRHLSQLLELVRCQGSSQVDLLRCQGSSQGGSQVVALALTLPIEYDFDPGLIAELANGGGMLLDRRYVEGIDATSFLDGYHLAPEGARRLSEGIAVPLASFFTRRVPGKFETASIATQDLEPVESANDLKR